MNCPNCQKVISEDSNFCEYCGIKIGNRIIEQNPDAPYKQTQTQAQTQAQAQAYVHRNLNNSTVYPTEPKDKSLAIILAILLPFFTWIYTYKKDSTKIWIALLVDIIGLLMSSIIIGALIILAVRIWAIVDVASKSPEWYRNYPNV